MSDFCVWGPSELMQISRSTTTGSQSTHGHFCQLSHTLSFRLPSTKTWGQILRFRISLRFLLDFVNKIAIKCKIWLHWLLQSTFSFFSAQNLTKFIWCFFVKFSKTFGRTHPHIWKSANKMQQKYLLRVSCILT